MPVNDLHTMLTALETAVKVRVTALPDGSYRIDPRPLAVQAGPRAF